MRRFDTYDVALELTAAMGPVIAKVKKRDPDLSNQLKRAVTSIPLNLSEGAQRQGKDRIQLYRVAAGSAAEVGTALSIAVSWTLLTDGDIETVNRLLDRLRALLWRLLEANQDRPRSNPAPASDPGPQPSTRHPDPDPDPVP